ncbi:MAG: glycoside hydrolase [Actinomycetota bacterium]|nr:glycoside hydrolase [Actinomycetota bacterium]
MLKMRAGRIVGAMAVVAIVASMAPSGAHVAARSGRFAYKNYAAPKSFGTSTGEPSIGVDWKTGAAMIQSGKTTLRVTFNANPATATWKDVTPPNSVFTMDPILFTDPHTGRTSVSQLISSLVVPGGGCSLAAVSDDDGATWIPSTGCGIPGTYDHQTIGGGPFAIPGDKISYEDANYYCGQNGITANCALSRDGGITYGAAVPVYYDLQAQPEPLPDGQNHCMGLHGHVKVGPDGTAYLPNFRCYVKGKDMQAVLVSQDDGATWTVRPIPGSRYNDFRSDPSVAIGRDNTVYFSYEDKDSKVKVAVSHDHGKTWTKPTDLETPNGLHYGVFPAAVAGDKGRAAVAFLGAALKGTDKYGYESKDYKGAWHLYISTTLDGGKTWTTVDATPTDPVQRGCIWWGNAGGCPSSQRNLLDFMDATLEKSGHVIVGYADGCIGKCVTGTENTQSAVATIARQTSGPSLFAAHH